MTLPEMALRFILNNPTVSTIIPGMRKVKNVEENLRASEQGPLPVDLYTGIAQASLGPQGDPTGRCKERPMIGALLGG